jgi:hypothetical protein
MKKQINQHNIIKMNKIKKALSKKFNNQENKYSLKYFIEFKKNK